MEKIKLENNNLKICEYLVNNLLRLQKQGINSEMVVSIRENAIFLELEEEVYVIQNMIDYKKVIDELSKIFRLVLTYMPRKNKQFKIIDILEKNKDNKNINLLINFKGVKACEYSCFKI